MFYWRTYSLYKNMTYRIITKMQIRNYIQNENIDCVFQFK